jgi:putative membrane protein
MTRTRALTLSAAVSVLALGLAAAPAAAQMSPTQQQPQQPRGAGDSKAGMDRASAKFMKDAAQTDMFEIEAAKIALEKSRNEAVRSFAQTMLDEHQKMSSQMKSAAGGQHAMAGDMAQIDRKHTRKLDDLRKESGANFDKKYIEMQVDGHRDALKLHQSYAKNGDNAELKKAANDALPHVQQHLQQAQALQRQTAEVPRERSPGGAAGDRAPTQQRY